MLADAPPSALLALAPSPIVLAYPQTVKVLDLNQGICTLLLGHVHQDSRLDKILGSTDTLLTIPV